MTILPQPPKAFDTEWLAQNNRVIEGRLRGLTNLEQRVYTAEQLLAGDLTAIGALTGTGFLARTVDDTWALRTLTGPAAGITVTNGAGIAGNPTLALANDLAALEGLGSIGIAVRTGSDSWAQRTITGTANEITVTNGSGASGNPTLSLPAALTFTGKTVTGGTFNSGAFNGTVGATTPSTGAFTTASTTGSMTVGDGTGTPVVLIDGDATSNVGINWRAGGVYNGQLVHVNGNAFYDAPGFLSIRTLAGSSRFFISLTGDVGIGTTSPSAKLGVNGSAAVTGALSCTGNATLGDAATDTVDVKGRIFGSNIHNNANGLAGASYIGSSTFTPSGTGVSNVTTITPAKAQLMRVGNVVTVSGTVDVSPTSGTTTTTFRMTTGVLSSLAALSDLAGVGAFIAGSAHGPVVVYADTTNDQASFSFTSASTATHSITYSFTFEVL